MGIWYGVSMLCYYCRNYIKVLAINERMKINKEDYKKFLEQKEQDLISYNMQIELIKVVIDYLKKKAK